MGLFGNKNKKPTGNKAYQQGYVSFTPDEVKQQEELKKDNSEAYDLLWQAMTTSSHVSQKDKKGNSVEIDDVYPVSLEETDEMDALLDQAEAKIQDHSDLDLKEKIQEMRNITAWSRKRHFNFSFLIIIGVIIALCFMGYKRSKPKDEIKKWDKVIATIDKNWVEQDTVVKWDTTNTNYVNKWDVNRFQKANIYKAYAVKSCEYDYVRYLGFAKRDQENLTNPNEYYQKHKADTEKDLKEHQEEAQGVFDKGQKLIAANYEEVKEMALDEAKEIKKPYTKSARRWTFWMWVFGLMIPLYIIAERPYGWMESRHRTEAKVLGGIRKVGYALASFLVTFSFGLNFVPDTVYKYSDGSTSRESSPFNIPIAILKVALLIGALLVVAIVSVFIMTYSTIVGLIRNYDWAALKTSATNKIQSKKADASATN